MIAGSSNGRTLASGARYWGSSPWPAAIDPRRRIASEWFVVARRPGTRRVLRGTPFSGTGRKIRAEKFFIATAIKNVLGRSPGGQSSDFLAAPARDSKASPGALRARGDGRAGPSGVMIRRNQNERLAES